MTLLDSVSLSFRATRAQLNLAQSNEGSQPRSISLWLELERPDDVRTPDKRSLRDVTWSIYLHESDAVSAEGTIGYIAHFPPGTSSFDYTPESCAAKAILDT